MTNGKYGAEEYGHESAPEYGSERESNDGSDEHGATEPRPRRPRGPNRPLDARLAEAREREVRAALRAARTKARTERLAARASAAHRRADTRRKIIAGALALEHARWDAAFRATLDSLIDQHVEREGDRALFGLAARAPLAKRAGDAGPE